MGQIHNKIILFLLGNQHITFLPVKCMLRYVHFPFNGEQFRGQRNFPCGILEYGIHSHADFLKVSCKPVQEDIEQANKYKQNRQQNDRVHVTAEYPAIQVKRRIIVHAPNVLQEGDHQICKIAAQQKRICDADDGGGNPQHSDHAEKNFHAELVKIVISFIFQWCNLLPIPF